MTDETYLYIKLWAIIVLAVADLLVLLASHPELGLMGVQPSLEASNSAKAGLSEVETLI
ncbi:MAG TPA: hypothetical protein VMF32_15745 [Xanthobacteraceae bacterium]|nr:hypothetical protein [Xanthobacteraceae bacterium]